MLPRQSFGLSHHRIVLCPYGSIKMGHVIPIHCRDIDGQQQLLQSSPWLAFTHFFNQNSFLNFFFLLTSPEAGHVSLGRLGHQEHSGSLICVSSEDHKSLILSRQKRMKELWGRDHLWRSQVEDEIQPIRDS